MRRPALTLLSSLLLLLARPAPSNAARPLTLDDALALARKNNRDLKVARARLEQAAVGIEQAWVPLLPQVTVQGKYTHNYKEVVLDFSSQQGQGSILAAKLQTDTFTDLYTKVGKPPSQTVLDDVAALTAYSKQAQAGPPIVFQKGEQLDGILAATVPLIVPSAYPGLTAAKRTRSAAESTLAVSESLVLFQTAQAFYVAAGNDELLVARAHAVEVARKTLAQAQTRFELGTVNRVEIARAELALVRAQQAEVESQDSAAQAYRALGTILGIGAGEELHVEPGERQVSAAIADDGASLAQRALTLRPELPQIERTIAAFDSTIDGDRYKWLPTLSAFGNLRVFNYAGFNGDQYSWAVGLSLDWTVYDGGLRDVQRHLVIAQRHESQARLSLLRDTVADEIFNASRALATRKRAIATAERSVGLSRETLDLVRVQHDNSTATQLDLLNAQDAVVAAEVSLAQARFDLAVADLTLRRAAGTFPASQP